MGVLHVSPWKQRIHQHNVLCSSSEALRGVLCWMPIADDRLEVLQVRKLIQCVRLQDSAQIAKLVKLGISNLVNYQGKELFGIEEEEDLS